MVRLSREAGLLSVLALLASALFLTAAVFEVGLRLFWDGFYLKDEHSWAEPHRVRGWRNRPNQRTTYGEPEFVTTIETNSWGYRGPPVQREKSKGRLRIFVLGDSFTLGVGVENDETFSARLTQRDPRIEAINGGVIGYGTSQQLLLLRDEALTFHPDLVIVAFFWNDVANNYQRHFARFRLVDGRLEYPPSPDPALEGAEAAGLRTRRAWLRHSHLYRFVSDRIKIARYTLRVAIGFPVEDGELLTANERAEAWELEFALLREIDRLVRASGAQMLLVLVPEQLQVEPERRIVGLVEADYEVQAVLMPFAEEAGIPVLDPLPGLRAAYEVNGLPLYYRKDRHLTAAGHQITARLIYAKLESMQLFEPVVPPHRAAQRTSRTTGTEGSWNAPHARRGPEKTRSGRAPAVVGTRR